jgi:hypothetical protein
VLGKTARSLTRELIAFKSKSAGPSKLFSSGPLLPDLYASEQRRLVAKEAGILRIHPEAEPGVFYWLRLSLSHTLKPTISFTNLD